MVPGLWHAHVGWLILGMAKVGLAWDVVTVTPEHARARLDVAPTPNVFQYDAFISSNDSSIYPVYWNLIDFPATNCRSIDISFGMPTDGSQAGDTAYLETVEQTLEPQSASTVYGVLGTLNATLDGRPWFLENAATRSADEIAINGTASCYTPTGL
jgi:hypothetical protein